MKMRCGTRGRGGWIQNRHSALQFYHRPMNLEQQGFWSHFTVSCKHLGEPFSSWVLRMHPSASEFLVFPLHHILNQPTTSQPGIVQRHRVMGQTCQWDHQERPLVPYHSFFFLIYIYLFGWAGSSLQYEKSFSRGTWDVIPWPGVEPEPPALGTRVLATGPPGKTLISFL